MASPTPAPSSANERTLLGHPPGLFLLFIVEMWERFSYYGMRGLLTLYMISVIAVHQLAPGVYTNTLTYEELDANDTTKVVASKQIPFQIRVGGQAVEPPASGTKTGEPTLVFTRLKEGPNDADGNATWIPDEAITDPLAPVVISGEQGAKAKFDNREVRYLVSNPSDREVEIRFNVTPDPTDKRVYIKANGRQGTSFSVKVKPDAQRTEKDKAFELAVATNDHDSGRNWSSSSASTLYGWYTGLAYLFPLIGGILADKFIGTHRSMLIGGLLIALGHVVLGISGFGALAQNALGLSTFIGGLALIVLGTGHFKPCVSTMVGELYKPGDPRRDGGFSIFYMGINLGAFICAFVCGTLGEQVGWHWGFGSAAVGMIAGLMIYVAFRPRSLAHVGNKPQGKPDISVLLFFVSCGLAALFGLAFHSGVLASLNDAIATLNEPANHLLRNGLIFGAVFTVIVAVGWFVMSQGRGDKAPTASIFLFMLFNAFFWVAFEQAGSSMNIFTEQSTDRSVSVPGFLQNLCVAPGLWAWSWLLIGALGLVLCIPMFKWIPTLIDGTYEDHPKLVRWLVMCVIGMHLLVLAILRPFGLLGWIADFSEIPATWFQSVNAGLIFIFAPIFAWLWLSLGRRNANPTQPAKIAFGLILLALGFVFMVQGAREAIGGDKVSAFWIFGAYFMHTMGELCLSPTGLSYVTKAAPVRFVSLLMGIWFISSFIANLGGGLVAAQVEAIERGEIKLPWSIGGQADFFMLFVVVPGVMGVLVLLFTPLLKKLLRNQND